MYDKLDKDLIAQPELWRMAMLITPQSLEIALYPPVENEEAIFRSFDYNPEAPSQLKAIEDIIYSNPLLLCDFKAITALIDCDCAMMMPEEVPQESMPTLLEKAALLPVEDSMTISTPASKGAIMVSAPDKELCDFLQHTFFNITFAHPLGLTTRYLSLQDSGIRSYLTLHRRRLSLINLNGEELLSANTFSYTEPMDAVYYALASRQISDIDAEGIALYYAGAQQNCDTIIPILRSYIAPIARTELPSLPYKTTKDTFDAPYILNILPLLCE